MAQVICSHCTEKCCHLSEPSGWIGTIRKHEFDDMFLLCKKAHVQCSLLYLNPLWSEREMQLQALTKCLRENCGKGKEKKESVLFLKV